MIDLSVTKKNWRSGTDTRDDAVSMLVAIGRGAVWELTPLWPCMGEADRPMWTVPAAADVRGCMASLEPPALEDRYL